MSIITFHVVVVILGVIGGVVRWKMMAGKKNNNKNKNNDKIKNKKTSKNNNNNKKKNENEDEDDNGEDLFSLQKFVFMTTIQVLMFGFSQSIVPLAEMSSMLIAGNGSDYPGDIALGVLPLLVCVS